MKSQSESLNFKVKLKFNNNLKCTATSSSYTYTYGSRVTLFFSKIRFAKNVFCSPSRVWATQDSGLVSYR